jgi:hypothetical protein
VLVIEDIETGEWKVGCGSERRVKTGKVGGVGFRWDQTTNITTVPPGSWMKCCQCKTGVEGLKKFVKSTDKYGYFSSF